MPLAPRRARAVAHLEAATICLLVVEWAVGMIFHAMDRGDLREAWFGWHKMLGILLLPLILAALAERLRTARARREHGRFTHLVVVGLYLISLMMIVTGLLSVSAWRDMGGSMELVGGARFPVLPGISTPVGDSSEQYHKLPFFAWLLMIYLLVKLIALWRTGRRSSLGRAASRRSGPPLPPR